MLVLPYRCLVHIPDMNTSMETIMALLTRTATAALLLLLTGGILHAEGVHFYKGSWQEALDRAAKENKYIMVDAYTDWCGWCKVMDKETFTDPDVAAVVNENFIPVKINFEEGIGIDLSMKFRVNSYPTILFFNPSGQLVHIQHGYMSPNQLFIDECNKALAIKDKRVFGFDSRDLNVPFPEFYRTSFLQGDDRAWPEEEEVVAFLDEQRDLFSEVSWSVIWRFQGGEKYKTFLLENQKKYAELYGEEEVSDAALSIVSRMVYTAAKDKDEKQLEKALGMLDTYFGDREDKDRLKLRLQQRYYENVGDWKKYARVSRTFIEDAEEFDANETNSICWTLYENCDDKEVLAKAVEWMKPVLVAEPQNWLYIDTYAALLYKTGNLAEAEKQAREAIRIGQEKDEDVSATQELLERITGKESTGS